MEADVASEDLDGKLKEAQSKLKLVKTHLRKSLGECESLRAQLAEANQNQQQLEAELLRQQTEQAQKGQEQSLRQNQEIQSLRAQLIAATAKAQQAAVSENENKEALALQLAEQQKQEFQMYKERNNQYVALQQHVAKLEDKVSALNKERIEIEKEKTAMVDKYCDLSGELEEQVAKYKVALIKSTQEVRGLHEDNERLLIKCESLTSFVKEQINAEVHKEPASVSIHLPLEPSPDAARVVKLTAELAEVRKELQAALEKASSESRSDIFRSFQKPRTSSESALSLPLPFFASSSSTTTSTSSIHTTSSASLNASTATTSSTAAAPASSWGLFTSIFSKPNHHASLLSMPTVPSTTTTTPSLAQNITEPTSLTHASVTDNAEITTSAAATTTTTTTTDDTNAFTTSLASTHTSSSSHNTELPVSSIDMSMSSVSPSIDSSSSSCSNLSSTEQSTSSPLSTLSSSPSPALSASFSVVAAASSSSVSDPPDLVLTETEDSAEVSVILERLRELELQLNTARLQLSQKEKQLAELLGTLSAVKQQKNVLFTESQAVQAKNDSIRKELDQTVLQRDEYKRLRTVAENAAGELRLELDKLYNHNSQLTRDKNTLQAEVEAMQMKLAAANTHHADLLAQCKLLEQGRHLEENDAHASMKLELETLQRAQADFTNTQRELAASLQSSVTRYEETVESLREREQALTRAEGELASCQHKLASSEGERSHLERQLESTRGQLHAAEEQNMLLQSANQILDRERQAAGELKASESANLAQLATLRADLSETKKALTQATELRVEVERERSLLQNEIGKMHQELEEAREEVKSMAKGITQMCETEFKLRARLSEVDPNYDAEETNELPVPEQTGFVSSAPVPVNKAGISASPSQLASSASSLSMASSYNFSSLTSRAGPANVSAGGAGTQGALACGCRAAAIDAEAKGEVIFSGMMEKRPFKFSLSSGWRPRLFFLYANRLEYYSVDPKTKICAYRGDIPFVAPIVLKRGRFESTYGLEISHPEGTFPLRCQSQASAVVWYEALVEVLKVKNTSGSFSFKSQSSVGSLPRSSLLYGGSLQDALDINDRSVPGEVSEFEAAVRARATSLGLPLIVSHCVDFLRREGLHVEGLFRVPGNAVAVQALREQYERGQVPTLTSSNDVAAVLKQYLSSLPSSLIPFELAQPLLDAAKTVKDERAEERAEYSAMREVLSKLPDINQRVLRHLLGLLFQVSENSDVNFMNANNCATVFAPTLLREEEPASTAPGAGARMLNFMSATTACVRVMILRYPLIFHRGAAEPSTSSTSRTTPSPPSSPSSSQSLTFRPAVSSISEAQQDPSSTAWSALPSLSTDK